MATLDNNEVKSAVEGLGKAFEEFKHTHQEEADSQCLSAQTIASHIGEATGTPPRKPAMFSTTTKLRRSGPWRPGLTT